MTKSRRWIRGGSANADYLSLANTSTIWLKRQLDEMSADQPLKNQSTFLIGSQPSLSNPYEQAINTRKLREPR